MLIWNFGAFFAVLFIHTIMAFLAWTYRFQKYFISFILLEKWSQTTGFFRVDKLRNRDLFFSIKYISQSIKVCFYELKPEILGIT